MFLLIGEYITLKLEHYILHKFYIWLTDLVPLPTFEMVLYNSVDCILHSALLISFLKGK